MFFNNSKFLFITLLLLLSLITMGLVQTVTDDISWRSGTRFFGTLSHNIDQDTNWSFPDEDGIVVLENNIATLSNKTFENSDINGNGISTLQNVTISGGSISTLTSPLSVSQGGTGTNSLSGFITSSKLANNTITSDLIPNNIISTDKIINNAITTDKIDNGAITQAKISSTLLDQISVSDNSITSVKIQDGTIQTVDIANNAITTNKIENNSITTEKIINNGITSSKIVNNAITTDKINNGAITEDKLSSNAAGALASKHIIFEGSVDLYGYAYFTETIYTKVSICSSSLLAAGTYYFRINVDSTGSNQSFKVFRIIITEELYCLTTSNNAWYNGSDWDNSGVTTLSNRVVLYIYSVTDESGDTIMTRPIVNAVLEED